MTTKEIKVWSGTAPKECDICKDPIKNIFIDGNTTFGGWGNMCPICHGLHGKGLGTGKGQKYQLNTVSKQWQKVEG